jgi:hypothetical protein
MGFLTDIRSGKRDPAGVGVYALIFWCCAGFIAGGGLAVYLVGEAEKSVLGFVLLGALIGCCIGFYAAFGKTPAARILALPGLPLAAIGMLVGI